MRKKRVSAVLRSLRAARKNLGPFNTVTVRDVVEFSGLSSPSARKTLEEFTLVGLVSVDGRGVRNDPYVYNIKDIV